MNFLAGVKKRAKKLQKSIIFPEASEERTFKAVETMLKEKTCRPILIGQEDALHTRAQEMGLKINWEKVRIISTKEGHKSQ